MMRSFTKKEAMRWANGRDQGWATVDAPQEESYEDPLHGKEKAKKLRTKIKVNENHLMAAEVDKPIIDRLSVPLILS